MTTRKRGEQLPADQVTAENKEKIDTDPAEAVHSSRQFESEQPCVIKDDYNDRKCAKKVEARLAFAISKAGINSKLATASRRLEWHLRFSHGMLALSPSPCSEQSDPHQL
jgi:hypothetical protein